MYLLLWLSVFWIGVSSNAIFKDESPGKSTEIVYQIGDLSQSHLLPKHIKDGLALLMENTCVNFCDINDVPGRTVNLPIQNMPELKCRIENGIFEVANCISSRRMIQHEVSHFLGFCHTQDREDWSDFIKIIPNPYNVDSFGSPSCKSVPADIAKYDYGSGMNQEINAVAEPVNMDYIGSMGQSVRFPFSDYRSINWLFDCAGKCTTQPKCLNGGYTHPRDCKKCMCNKYYTGDLCETPKHVEKLTCEGKKQHVWEKVSFPDEKLGNATLKDDFRYTGEDLWHIIEAPENMQIQVEVKSRQNQWANIACAHSAVEINDGDLNQVGRMFCESFRVVPPLIHNFTAKSNVVGFHAEYNLNKYAEMSAKFTLLGCDGQQ